MGRGRRSGEQIIQATSGHYLKKKSRSRTGKGINSREFDPRRRGGNSSLAAGERGRRFVAGERRGGGSSPVAGGRRTGMLREACGNREARASGTG